MGRKRTPGLYKRGESWHIDKKTYGRRLCESCHTSDLEEAERYLARRLETLRQTVVYGIRPQRSFREAATKYLLENQYKRSITTDAYRLRILDRHVGDLWLDEIHMGTLQAFIAARRQEGVKTRTINNALKLIRHILNLAAGEWIDEYGLTWLGSAPKIKLFPEVDARKPYPLSWDEQTRLFQELPPHLERMALFAVNTGCRDAEICQLRWEWEMSVPELNTSVFIIPGTHVKNREDRLVILNNVAMSVVEAVRGEHSESVFVYQGKPVTRMLNSAWLRARERAGLSARVHDLKHTFGRRLRAAGVSFEDRQDLLGHKSSRITTHYSASEIRCLLEASNRVVSLRDSTPTLTLLKRVS
ncbi:MAG: tyrosine-type recombinase/integrase [Legionellales bacterium]|nr:tyrosine-type recombinase/integrase [Legionellales bacterium]